RYYLGHVLAMGAPAERVAHAFEELSAIYYMRRDYDTVRRVVGEHLGPRDVRSIEDTMFRIKSVDLENCLADIALLMQAQPIPFRRADIDAGWLDRGLMLGS